MRLKGYLTLKVSYGTETRFSGKQSAVTIGAFDGFHTGHRKIVENTVSIARMTSSVPCAVTFEKKYPALSTLNEKLQHLRDNGIEKTVVMLSEGEWKNWTAEYFIREFLIGRMKAGHAVVGRDFRFGKSREGSISTLEKTAGSEMETHSLELEKINGTKVSSSAIRKHLSEGDLQRCRLLMGRNYSFTGKIVEGKKLGRKLGFPTVNFSVPEEKILPEGIFLCRSLFDNERKPQYPGACFIGGSGGRKTEIHFIDRVPDRIESVRGAELLEKISDIEKFTSNKHLSEKINDDVQKARKIFKDKWFDTA